jgi:hypothetical protein
MRNGTRRDKKDVVKVSKKGRVGKHRIKKPHKEEERTRGRERKGKGSSARKRAYSFFFLGL